jgi:hypothetical protein
MVPGREMVPGTISLRWWTYRRLPAGTGAKPAGCRRYDRSRCAMVALFSLLGSS